MATQVRGTPTERLVSVSLQITNNQTAAELKESTGTASIKFLRGALRYMLGVGIILRSTDRAGVTRYRLPKSPRLYHEIVEDIERGASGDFVEELLDLGHRAVGKFLHHFGVRCHSIDHVCDLHRVLIAHWMDDGGDRERPVRQCAAGFTGAGHEELLAP
jgi:hypothetical protein